MSITINELDHEELNEVANNILDRLNKLKENIKKSMMVGEKDILKGIEIVEEVIKELNPSEMDDDILSMIESCANIVLYKKEERIEHVNSYVHYGINMCYTVLEGYNR